MNQNYGAMICMFLVDLNFIQQQIITILFFLIALMVDVGRFNGL